MKIEVLNICDKVERVFNNLEDFTEKALSGKDYDTGAIEAVTATAENNSRATGRLLGVLLNKNILDDTDIKRIIDYHSEIIITKEK